MAKERMPDSFNSPFKVTPETLPRIFADFWQQVAHYVNQESDPSAFAPTVVNQAKTIASPLIIQDEGTDQPDLPRLNFAGAGVTVTPGIGVNTVDIPGGSGTAAKTFRWATSYAIGSGLIVPATLHAWFPPNGGILDYAWYTSVDPGIPDSYVNFLAWGSQTGRITRFAIYTNSAQHAGEDLPISLEIYTAGGDGDGALTVTIPGGAAPGLFSVEGPWEFAGVTSIDCYVDNRLNAHDSAQIKWGLVEIEFD